jgi:hypothetical protein
MIKMTPITTNRETVPGKDPSSFPEKAISFIFSSEDPILVTGLRDLSVLEWSRKVVTAFYLSRTPVSLRIVMNRFINQNIRRILCS